MKAAIISLGCAKNLVDSERIMAILKEYGYDLVDEAEKAEIVIVNTCGFIAAAKEESIDAIISCLPLKKRRCRCLVVSGCLVRKYEAELRKEIPEVDLWLTSLNFESIGRRLGELFPENRGGCESGFRRVLTTPAHWAYLKIAEGCDNRCTFCAIPEMRGPYVSRPMEEILAEAETMAERGVREIELLAQDTTVYGRDLYGEPRLKELLKELTKIDLRRVRLLYSYPERIDRELAELLSGEEKLCAYLDIPMQHVSDPVLKAMGRPERRDKLKELIAMIRDVDPDFAIRSTFIVGFPGEREEDFNALCDFLAEVRLDWVGVFPYSREDNTKAYFLPDQIDEETKNDRYDTVMALLSRISLSKREEMIGRVTEVMIDGESDPDDPESAVYPYVGRCASMAPEVDGIVRLKSEKPLRGGDCVKAEIIAADVYDLTARVINA